MRRARAVTENWAHRLGILQLRPMSFAEIPAEVDGFGTGEVSLVGPEVLRELLRSAADDGYLSVVLSPPGPGQRGELALVISEAIDGALEQRGACPPGIGAATDLGASLSDQLYRARLVELRGLALALPTLEGIANLAGALDAEDSAVLRWWMAATRERPVRVYIDAKNRYAGVYDRPTPLQELLEQRPRRTQPPAPALAPEVNASSEAMELSSPPPVVAWHEPPAAPCESPSIAEAPLSSAAPLEPAADFGGEFVAVLADATEQAPAVDALPPPEPAPLELQLTQSEPVVAPVPAEEAEEAEETESAETVAAVAPEPALEN